MLHALVLKSNQPPRLCLCSIASWEYIACKELSGNLAKQRLGLKKGMSEGERESYIADDCLLLDGS